MVQDLYVLMITAAVVSIVFKFLKQPVVLGYIVAGVLVGPNLFGETLVNGDNVKSWGDIGVLFVLFCIGLEFRLKNLISSGKIAAVGALTIILGMMALGYWVGQDAKLDMINSLFLAGMLCMSSTTIVMKVIDEAGMKKERFVKGATSILIVEDVVAVVLMVLLSSIAIRHQFEGAELLNKVLILAITLTAWFVTGILIIPTLLRIVKKHLNDETLIILALGLCLGMVLTAEEAGFSSALGAFVMGSILAETVESHRIEKLMTPLKNVFAAIFFISVGMLINPSSLVDYWYSILWVSLVVIVGMILFATLGCWWGGATMRDSMLTSFSFVQIGEFSFIIASLGTSLGVLDPVIYPIIVASSVVTTFLTPYVMKAALPCYTFLYSHAPAGLRSKIDQRERQVAEAETAASSRAANSFAEKARHAVRNTFITKRLVNLFIKNMSAHFVAILVICGAMLTSCTVNEDNPTGEQLFEQEMTAALADARIYGPQTEAFAQEVATLFNGYVTDINYKTRESATRKCKTDNSRPYDLKDLARTTIIAGWDSIEIKPVIDNLNTTATERGFFGRYKHQTSDYGYWGDIVNLKYVKLYTEIQVKTYGMFYASLDSATVTSVIGDSLYKYIHDKTGVEPGLSHRYYEIMRADTSSAATIAKYKQLAIDYHYRCDHIDH